MIPNIYDIYSYASVLKMARRWAIEIVECDSPDNYGWGFYEGENEFRPCAAAWEADQ